MGATQLCGEHNCAPDWGRIEWGCDAFGPDLIWSPDFQSTTSCPRGQTTPIKLIPLDKRSHQVRSPWTNSPKKFGPPDQMVPNKFGPPIAGSPQPVLLDKCNILGTICPEGLNWLGTISPWGSNFWGPIFHGDWIGWGLFVKRDKSIGDQFWDQMSRDRMHSGPNLSQP